MKIKVDFILNRLLLIVFFAILIVYASREISDLDLWLHLKTGEVILKNGFVPLNDIFSFTIQGKPWINHEWLFQVLAYLFFSFGHADGLILMQNIVVIATFFMLYLMGMRKGSHVFVFIVLYLTLLAIAYRFTIRPDIFSLFFLTLYLFLIKDFIDNKTRAIWILPILQIVWTNMHGFSFTGPLLILIFLSGELIKRAAKLPFEWRNTQRLDDNEIFQLVILFVLMSLASLANPAGLAGAAYPFSVLGQISGKGRVVFQYIQELAKPVTLKNIFDLNFFLFYKAVIVISFFSFRFNHKHMDISDFILWFSFLCFSLLAIRNVAYFAIIAAYVIFSNAELASESGKTLPFKIPSERLKTIGYYVAMAFLFYYPVKGTMKYLESSNYNFDTYKLKSILWGVAEERFPENAVKFLSENKLPRHMFNDFNSGSYLIGKTYPARQVFIDGRTELYGPEFFLNYVALGEGKKAVLEKTIARYNIQGFFLTIATNDLHLGLVRYLLQNPRWRVVYFDDSAIVFLKDTKENSDLIKKFSIDLRRWSPQRPDFLKLGIAFRYPLPYVERARFLNMLGYYEAAAKEAKLILEVMPNNAEAFKFMTDFALEQKHYDEAFRYARDCLLYAPGDLQMRSKLALIYHDLKDDGKALKVIDAVIKKRPQYAEGYYMKALILKETDRNKAKELLKKASKLASKEPRYQVLLGDLLSQEGDLLNARKAWAAALEYDSANETLRKKLESPR